MIIAVQNVIYDGKIFKPNEALPCYDNKMVEAWKQSGVAIDTDKEQAKTAPVVSEKATEETKIKTRTKK